MNRSLLLLIGLVLLGQVMGRMVTFSMITFEPQASVTVGGKTIELKPVDTFSSVKSALVICPDEPFEYFYTVGGRQEGFVRRLEAGLLTTKNEFFGRSETMKPLKGMGYPPDKPQWTRSIGKAVVFDDSYIPTVIIDSSARDFFITPPDNSTLARVTVILQDEIFSFTNVPVKAQNRFQDKFQFRVKFDSKMHKRKVFKFRACPSDPVFFRQALYGDILAAIGNPVHNQVTCRVYLSDGTPIGLYLMIEVTSSNSFIKSQFYGNEETGKINAPEKLGYALDCSTGADFIKGGPFYAFQYSVGENNDKIGPLTDAMHSVDVFNEEEVKKFSREWFDLDIFFKALAVEYLAGHWDSYWMFTTNFVMYDDPLESTDSTYKYYFLDQDFDLTFGVGLGIDGGYNQFGLEFPKQSYKTLVNRQWSISDIDGNTREAINIFLTGDSVTQKMFENHLIDIVKHVFNPVALGRRLDEYINRYKSEVEWDYGLERLHIGADPNKTRNVWDMSDFNNNLDVSIDELEWGLREWINSRASAVASEFGFEWDAVPLDPPEKKFNSKNGTVVVNPNYNYTGGAITIKAIDLTFMVVVLASLILFI